MDRPASHADDPKPPGDAEPRRGRRTPIALAVVAFAAAAGVVGAARCGEAPFDRSARTSDTATLAGAVPERGVATSRVDAAPADPRDWAEIRQSDTIRVGVQSNSTTYFIYKGLPLGYEYELLREFAADHRLALKLIVVQRRDSLLRLLHSGRADIIAARLIPMPEDSGRVNYTRALYRTDPVLVQQKAPVEVAQRALPDAVDTILEAGPAERAPRRQGARGGPPASAAAVRARIVQHPSQLAGRRVTVPDHSPHVPTLLELADSISGDIHVIEVDASSEKVIREVAKGNTRFTVADGNIAALQGAYFRNLLIRPVIGASRKVAWATRRDAPQLLDTLDAWIGAEKTGPLFDRLYKKYYVDQRGYQTRVTSRYLTTETGRLSPYDSLLKAYAPRLGWDWRLLGSQMYQESRFQPRARSWVGATGLMQLMPATAREFGVRSLTDPRQNVEGGVRFLEWLQRYWEKRIADSTERLRFILASYNAGAGHVEDAQRLARAKGDDPEKWEHVAYWLLQLSKAEFHSDPVVKYGFCRGTEPVTYVSLILDRFEHYKQFVTPAVAAGGGAPAG